ncbi:4759_t:CDS:2, partial [Cetraspora pellucida]
MPSLRPKSSPLKAQKNIVPYWNDQVATWSKKSNSEVKCMRLNTNDDNDESGSHNGKRKKFQTTRRAKRRKKESLIRSIKIRVYPNKAQKDLLKQWIVLFSHSPQTPHQNNKRVGFYGKSSLDHSITSAILARNEVIRRNNELRKQGQPQNHKLHFISKKSEQQTISIRAHYCRNPLRFYLRLLHNKQLIQANTEYPRYKPKGKVTLDSKLSYSKKLRHWTFIWVYGKEICENQADYTHVASINPGVRTFLTCYSPTIGHGNFGDNDINRIFRLGLVLDDLISRTSKAPAKKPALWLTRTFDVIVLPTFDSTRMSCRQKRKINSKTVRKMMSWAYARFRNRLISKMKEFGKIVITSVSEAYTSKTCSRCGYIKNNLGGNRQLG